MAVHSFTGLFGMSHKDRWQSEPQSSCILFCNFTLILCVWVAYVYVSALHVCLVTMEARRGTRSSETGVVYGCEPPCESWEHCVYIVLKSNECSLHSLLTPSLCIVKVPWYHGNVSLSNLERILTFWRAIWTINLKSLSLKIQVTGQIYILLNELYSEFHPHGLY